MIERYQTNLMSGLWSKEKKYDTWKHIEIFACEANDNISQEIIDELWSKKTPISEQIEEEELKTKHDLVAFLNVWTDGMSDEAKKYVHYNLTSSDIKDTALVCIIKECINELTQFYARPLMNQLWQQTQYNREVYYVARTHGKVAQEKSLGLVFLNWYAELKRAVQKLELAEDNMFGKLSGPIGINKEFEEKALNALHLKVDPVPTQVISRDTFTDVIEGLARISICLERIALNIRLMNQSGIEEMSEQFSNSQVGSSAMPHKKNPVKSERICGLSRIIRNYVPVIYENSVLWGDRDISHSSSEKVVFENAFHLVHFMLLEMQDIINNLKIHEENIQKNIDDNFVYLNSEEIMNWLIDGVTDRKEAHEFIKSRCDEKIYELASSITSEFGYTTYEDDLINIDKRRKIKLKENVDKIFGNIGGRNAIKEGSGSSK